jgi:spermidine synthase
VFQPSRRAFFAIFAVSGFSGLIYESIWTHYLKLFLGHAAYAQTLVLAIFMGGMAVGSAIAGRWSARTRDLLVAYAAVEAIIGAAALIFHPVFVSAVEGSYAAVLPRLGSPAAVDLYKWGLAALLILPQSVLLGATFPLMTAGVIRRFPDEPGRSVSMLYFTNSLGAAAGVLASGFVMIRVLGLPGTVRLAGALNLAVALAVWRLALRPSVSRAEVVESGLARPPDRRFALLLLVALGTGASSFMYEIGWIRMLTLVLGASTHAFELMLAAFILGLAFGGLWIRRRTDTAPSLLRTLGVVQVAMGLLALATLPAYGLTFDLMQAVVRGAERNDTGYALFNLASNGIAAAVMLPATFCAGMTLPLVTVALLRDGYGERSIGSVYAANTVGAIAGVFLAVHVGLPLLGLKGLITGGAALDVAIGLFLLAAAGGLRTPRIALLAAAGVAAVAAVSFAVDLDVNKMASGVYRHGNLLTGRDRQVVHHRDGKTATVSVIAEARGARMIKTNGKADATLMMVTGRPPEPDEATMVLLGAIPLALHPEARSVAAIGFGSGLTTHTLLGSPRLERVDTIEIEPEMVTASLLFLPRVARAYSDPRGRVHVEDAKSFFAAGGLHYDVIVSEPSNPWVSGVAGLFSREFYQVARRHLTDGGLFVQWLQLYEIDIPLVVSVLKALDRSFEDWVVFATNDGDAVIVARKGGPVGPVDSAPFQVPELADATARIGVANASDLEFRRIGSRASWGAFVRGHAVATNSDYDPVLDQGAARSRFLGASAVPLVGVARFPLPLEEMLGGAASPRAVTPPTETPLFEDSRRVISARAARDTLVAGTPGRGAWNMPEPLLEATTVASAWLRSCRAGVAGPFPVDAFLQVAVAVWPMLAADELETVWSGVETCASSTSPDDRRWIDLLRAVGHRDGPGMSTAGSALLGTGQLAGVPLRYAVAATLLGLASHGDGATASQVWSRHRDALAGTPDLALEILTARARATD